MSVAGSGLATTRLPLGHDPVARALRGRGRMDGEEAV
jgi:hypothetical protein